MAARLLHADWKSSKSAKSASTSAFGAGGCATEALVEGGGARAPAG